MVYLVPVPVAVGGWVAALTKPGTCHWPSDGGRRIGDCACAQTFESGEYLRRVALVRGVAGLAAFWDFNLR